MSLPFEVIIIDDASRDETLENIKDCAPLLVASTHCLTRFRIYSFRTSAFETACDSFGFSVAEGRMLLEIQADMSKFDFAFDTKMSQALDAFDDILMISGRGVERLAPIADWYQESMGSDRASGTSLITHILKRMGHQFKRRLHTRPNKSTNESATISSEKDSQATKINLTGSFDHASSVVTPDSVEFNRTGRAGRLGLLIEIALQKETRLDRRVWLGETVMRGPLLIDHQKFKALGGFDTKRFFQGFDDHDLALRGFTLFGFRCGFVPVGFNSPLDSGTTRKPRSLRSEWEIARQLVRIRSHWRSSALANYAASYSEANEPRMAIRDF